MLNDVAQRSIIERVDPTALEYRVLRLTKLDGERNPLVGAGSGFVVNNNGRSHLYTCWHVITGLDFFEPKVMDPPKPKHLRVEGIRTFEQAPGLIAQGRVQSFELSLYTPPRNSPLGTRGLEASPPKR